MNLKQFAGVLIRVFGIYVLFRGFFALLTYAPLLFQIRQSEVSWFFVLFGLFSVGLMLVIGGVMVSGAKAIADRVLAGIATGDETVSLNIDPQALLTIGMILLGVFFLVSSLDGVVSWVSALNMAAFSSVVGIDIWRFAGTVLQMVCSVCMIAGASSLSRLFLRVRGRV